MATSAEKAINDAIVTAIAARTYMTTNSVQVTRWGNDSLQRTAKNAIVNVQKRERLQPNYDKYRIPLELQAMTYTADDEDGVLCDGIYQDLQAWLDAQTAAGLTTTVNTAGITIDGIVAQPNDEQFTEDYRHEFARAHLFVTIT